MSSVYAFHNSFIIIINWLMFIASSLDVLIQLLRNTEYSVCVTPVTSYIAMVLYQTETKSLSWYLSYRLSSFCLIRIVSSKQNPVRTVSILLAGVQVTVGLMYSNIFIKMHAEKKAFVLSGCLNVIVKSALHSKSLMPKRFWCFETKDIIYGLERENSIIAID